MDLFVDTHCHINSPDFDDLPEVLLRANEAGVGRMLCVGYDLESSISAVKIAGESESVYAAVGIHPYDAPTFTAEVEDQFRMLARSHERIVGIGETGLDYFRAQVPPSVQQDSFRRHIRLAHELGLPLIVHSREAQEDVLRIVQEEGIPKAGAVMHCLPADRGFALKAAELGCFLGIAGQITFKNAGLLREIVEELPVGRLILETDSPYLTPHPHRGKRNEPSYIPLIAAGVASAKGLTIEEVATVTTANARTLFGLGL